MSTQTPSFQANLSSNPTITNTTLNQNFLQDNRSQALPSFGNNTTQNFQYQTAPNLRTGPNNFQSSVPVTSIAPQTGGLSSLIQNAGSTVTFQNQVGRPVQRPQQISQQIPQQISQQFHQIPQQIGGGLIAGQQTQHVHTTGVIPGAVQGVGAIPQKPASSSRIQYIPYDKTFVEYETKQVYSSMWVPVQKKCLNYYAIEHITEYIPREVDDVRYELVPEQHINYRLQYVPVEKQIVHLPHSNVGNVQYVNQNIGYTGQTIIPGVVPTQTVYGNASYGNYSVAGATSGLNIPGYQPLASRITGSLPKTNFVTTDGYVPSYLIPSTIPNSYNQPFLPTMPPGLGHGTTGVTGTTGTTGGTGGTGGTGATSGVVQNLIGKISQDINNTNESNLKSERFFQNLTRDIGERERNSSNRYSQLGY